MYFVIKFFFFLRDVYQGIYDINSRETSQKKIKTSALTPN